MPEPIPPEELRQSLFLLDGSALAYRAHFAMARSSLSSAKGVPTGALFGFTGDLRRILRQVGPRYIAVVFDTPEPTFRHHLYPEYKATREKMPEELVQQLPFMRQAAELLGIRVLMMPGFEADDVMGTLARRAEAQGLPVFLVTGDKDFMQLVSEKIRLYNILKKDEEVAIIGPPEVRERFGVGPDRVVDILALMGDASDNIPGIPGIGEKGAMKLLAGGKSLDDVLLDPGQDVSPKLKQSLIEHRDLGLLSRQLATIDTAVPIALPIEDLEYRGPRAEDAAAFFREFGFRTFAEELVAKTAPAAEETAYEIVSDAAALQAMIEHLDQAPLFSVDTETTGLDTRRVAIVGLSFSVRAGQAWYVPLRGMDAPDWKEAGGRDGVLDRLRPILEDPRPRKCGQNVKYDLLVLRHHGIRLRGVTTDTMVASYLVEPEQRERNLDALALRHFQKVKIKTEELIGKGKNQITMDLLPVLEVGRYAGEDADYTLRLAGKFLPELGTGDLRRLHDDVEIPLIEVLADMEDDGVRVDPVALRAMARALSGQVAALEERIHAAAGQKFNVNSPQQLGKVLFEDLKVHEGQGYRPKKTKTGWATGQEVLEELADHPIPALILEYRSLSKLLNTYVAVLPDLVDPETGRIHTSYHQTVAITGRLSSSDPNLQNIPIRTETGKRIRKAFLPADDDHVLLSADYSQVELRILAHLSEDGSLIRAFQEGADIHRDTAARVFGVAAEAVDPVMRGRAKAINFGILYGMGPQRLSRETGFSLDEAKAFIDRYFAAFPAVRAFLEGLKAKVRALGYAETILGRRRPIPDIGSSNGMLRAAAENMAVNTPIQGSAADILKLAMVRLHRRLPEDGLATRMILTVHDELVFDVPRAEIARAEDLVRREMEGAWPLRVPLRVDLGHGRNWLEAH